MVKYQATITATKDLLLAAYDASTERNEFTDCDLTVAAWRRNRNRFGLRGYEDTYPDHKRVMVELMGSKAQKENVVRNGWIQKTRPNHYAITPLGRSEAERLLLDSGAMNQTERSAQPVYDAIAPYIHNDVFRAYRRDPQEPRIWQFVATFLGVIRNDGRHYADRMQSLRRSQAAAREWMDSTGNDRLRRGASGGGIAINRQDLDALDTFVNVIEVRFDRHIKAIQKMRES